MYRKESPATIQSMFNSIAQRYDLTNAVLSLSLHKKWNRSLIRQISHPSSSHVLLDLCSGTGDIAFDYLRITPSPCHTYLVDFSSGMLEYAKRKAGQLSISPQHQLSYIEADVQYLPFSDQMANCATMAYGIRNVQDMGHCMREVFRVLKPGGCFGILELTRPHNPLLRWGHQFYLKGVMPFLGKWLTHNKEAYHYLCQSIQTFATPDELQKCLKESGFQNINILPLAGGIATILLGYKP